MLPNIGAPELIIILIVLLLVVGPGKLPEIGSAFGKTLREFRKASTELQETAESATRLTEPPRPPVTAPAASGRAGGSPIPNELQRPVANGQRDHQRSRSRSGRCGAERLSARHARRRHRGRLNWPQATVGAQRSR